MSPVFAQLALGGLCLLGGAALGVSAIMHEQTQRRRFRERLAMVAARYARVNPLGVMGRWSATRSEPMDRMIAAAAQVFAYHPDRADHYQLRWVFVLGIALMAARAIAALVSIYAGEWSLLIVPVLWVMLSRGFFNWSEQRRRNALYAQFPDALAMIVRAVRVGIPLGEGIRTVAREAAAPTSVEFGLVYDRVSIGVTLEDALREMATRNNLQEYRFFTTALALQSQTGGGLSDALEGLADVMRRRLALRSRGNALAAEAKTSIIILAALPFVSGGALGVLNPQYIGRLFNDHGCQKLLLAAIIMLSGGLLVMRGMIRKILGMIAILPMMQLATPWLGAALAGGAALVLGLLLMLYRDQRRAERLSMRLRMVQLADGARERETDAELVAPLRIITAVGEAIARSGMLSTRTLEDLRQTLRVAGFRGGHGLGLFVGTKLLLVVGLPLATLTLPLLIHREIPYPAAMLSLAAGIGLLAPDKIVQRLRKRYLRDLEGGIPDALDMMVICGQAGLGLEASIERVGIEIHYAHPAIAEELTRTAHEMQVNADTRTALVNLGKRTGLESVRRLAGVLIQSIQYGTPLTQALRSLSAEQRQEMLVTFEGRAARLPVLLTIPMIVFILPCVFLIVTGPAMVDVYRTMMK